MLRLFPPHGVVLYLESKKLMSVALQVAEKGTLHISAACFLQPVFLSSNVRPAGKGEMEGGSSRRGPPLGRRGSGMWSWRKRR